MTRVFCLLFIFFCAVAQLFAEPKIPVRIHDSVLKNHPERMSDLDLKKAFKSNFSNSGSDEYIAFYCLSGNNEMESFYDKIIIYCYKNDRIVDQYSIFEQVPFNYNKNSVSNIKQLEQDLGPWNGYFYSVDFSKNGTNQLILFPCTGLS